MLTKLPFYNIEDIFKNNHFQLYQLVKGVVNRKKNVVTLDELTSFNLNKELIEREILLAINYFNTLYSDGTVKKVLSDLNLKSKSPNKKHLFIENIEYKQLDNDISSYLSKYCHYLHTPRSDEYISYGAFIENESLPIAYTSFSRQDRECKKEMLHIIGLEAQNSLEMTRAWCSNNAPKNMMSSLFQHAINELNKTWHEHSKNGIEDKTLQSITTTINPNLGFKGSSFFGTNFIPIALRPYEITYIPLDDEYEYVTRREIEKYDTFNEIVKNKIPVLPLNEMILCLNKENLNTILESEILMIDKDNYDKILKRSKK